MSYASWRTFDAHVVWMHERPLDPQKSYLLKHTSQTTRVQVDKVISRTELTTLEQKVIDLARQQLCFHRVSYDHLATANLIRQAGLPDTLATRLEKGH